MTSFQPAEKSLKGCESSAEQRSKVVQPRDSYVRVVSNPAGSSSGSCVSSTTVTAAWAYHRSIVWWSMRPNAAFCSPVRLCSYARRSATSLSPSAMLCSVSSLIAYIAPSAKASCECRSSTIHSLSTLRSSSSLIEYSAGSDIHALHSAGSFW